MDLAGKFLCLSHTSTYKSVTLSLVTILMLSNLHASFMDNMCPSSQDTSNIERLVAEGLRSLSFSLWPLQTTSL